MPSCAFDVCAHDRTCHTPATHQVVYEMDDELGMETQDYRAFCGRHAERYAGILLASGVVKTARAVEVRLAGMEVER